MRLRRPSFPTVIAFAALFVALGGPAQAERFVQERLGRGSVDSRAVENRSLQTKDLRRKTVRALRRTPNSSVTEAKLRNGAVTPGKLAQGAVSSVAIADNGITAADLAPGSVRGLAIVDGSLGAHDLGRFYGRFRTEMPAIPARTCDTFNQPGLAPERAGANISEDLVVVHPNSAWPEDQLSMTVANSVRTDRFAITVCNVSSSPYPASTVEFRYLVIDLP